MLTLAEAKYEIANGFFPDVDPETDKFQELLDSLEKEDRKTFAEWVYELRNLASERMCKFAGRTV